MKWRHKLANLWRNLVYLSQIDYKRALSDMLKEGRRIEHNAPSDLRHCHVCGAELGRTFRLNGEIVSYCPRWQVHPTIPMQQQQFPDFEAHTDKLASTTTQQLPGQRLLNYLREKHSDEEAGPETKMHRAVQSPRPR